MQVLLAMGLMERRASGTQIINPNSCCRKSNFRLLPNAGRAMSANIK